MNYNKEYIIQDLRDKLGKYDIDYTKRVAVWGNRKHIRFISKNALRENLPIEFYLDNNAI